MNSLIPLTPADVVPLSQGFKIKLRLVLPIIKLLNIWKHPDKKAATSYEEMSWKDKVYWFYKSRNPITRPEKGPYLLQGAESNKNLALPKGFKKKKTVTFSAVGDLFYTENLQNSKDIFYGNVEDLIFNQDISYANLEAPVTENMPAHVAPVDKEAPLTFCTAEQCSILTHHKGKHFDVINTANNHIFDLGTEGLEKTQAYLSKKNILNVGTNAEPQEYATPKILTKNGIKFGLTSVTYGLNGQYIGPNDSYRIHVSKLSSKFVKPDLDLARQQIDQCKKNGCDFIIATLHWGYEFEFFPRNEQIRSARELVEYGADAIICHHPHVIQPVEHYRTKRDPDRIAVIAYSLGSLGWTFSAPHINLSAILNLKFSKGTLNSKSETYIEDSKITPVFRNYIEENGVLVTRLENIQDYIEKPIDGVSHEYIKQLIKYSDLVFGKALNHSHTANVKEPQATSKLAA